jgi:hypothetical protein
MDCTAENTAEDDKANMDRVVWNMKQKQYFKVAWGLVA